MGKVVLGVLVAAVVVGGCSSLFERDITDPCAPVDPGGECFVPSADGYRSHALESATAWPQLRGVQLTVEPLVEARDPDGNIELIAPMTSDGRVVAASRFVPVSGVQVKLGEVTLFDPPLASFPRPQAGQRLVLRYTACLEPGERCLFKGWGWEFAEG